MNKEVREKVLDQLSKSTLGDALRDLIDEKLAELKDSSTIKGDNKLVELEARQLAITKLQEIFSRIKKVEPLPLRAGEYE